MELRYELKYGRDIKVGNTFVLDGIGHKVYGVNPNEYSDRLVDLTFGNLTNHVSVYTEVMYRIALPTVAEVLQRWGVSDRILDALDKAGYKVVEK